MGKKYLIDLFCGIGGVSHGFSKNGYTVVLAIDLWENALNVHKHHYPDALHEIMQLGTPASKRFINSFIKNTLKLTSSDHLHIHGSPPCQQLSRAFAQRNEEQGLSLTEWTLKYFKQLEKSRDIPCSVSWTIEQVPNQRVMKLASQHNVSYNVYLMSDYGVCQKRRRLIISSCDALETKIAKRPCKSIEEYITVPEGTKFIANSVYTPARLTYSKRFNISYVPFVKGETIGYTIIAQPCWFVKNDKQPIRSFNWEDNLALQTFPKTYFNGITSAINKKQLIANAVPPMFAFHVSKGIDKCYSDS